MMWYHIYHPGTTFLLQSCTDTVLCYTNVFLFYTHEENNSRAWWEHRNVNFVELPRIANSSPLLISRTNAWLWITVACINVCLKFSRRILSLFYFLFLLPMLKNSAPENTIMNRVNRFKSQCQMFSLVYRV